MKTICILLTLAALTACEVKLKPSSDNVDAFSETTLAGKIAGGDWVFVSGRAKPSHSTSGNYYFDFWNVHQDQPCQTFGADVDRKVLGSLPLVPGIYTIGSEASMTFSILSEGSTSVLVITSGKIQIDEVTETEVRGKLLAEFDGDNRINGLFTINLCSE